MALPSVGGGYQVGDGNLNEIKMGVQGTPATPSTSATLTAAQIATGLLVVDQAASGATTLTLPTGALMDAYFTNAKVGSSIDLAVCNIGDQAAEDATLAVGTGWTIYGNAVVASNAAATDQSAGIFRLRKTGTATWVAYRIA